jgi:hypothetical protein
MAVEYLDFVTGLAVLVASVILVFAFYRAIEFGRVLVAGTYKSRAKWTAIFLASAVFLLLDSNGLVPYLSSVDDSDTGFVLITVALPLFVNSNIRTAREADFFHRDALHWRSLWRATMIVVLCSVAISGASIAYSPGVLTGTSSVWWANLGYALSFIVLIIVSIYGGGSLTVAARRTQDPTMRKFVRMLGLALLGLFFYFTVWIPIDYFAPGVGDAISELGFIMSAYYLYRAVMSLSPLGKMKTLEGTTDITTPSHTKILSEN